MSDRCHEHSDEHNTNKHGHLVHSIQKNCFTMSADPTATMVVNFFHEKYLPALDKFTMVIPTHPHDVQGST